MALIGYARVSTSDQSLDLQLDSLREAGCTKVFTDEASGARKDRMGLSEALEYLREGDTLVVWRLDRLSRSLRDLLDTVNKLDARNIGLKSITEAIDTNSPGGRLVYMIFGSIAEFERAIICQRVNAWLAAARNRGRIGGRPKAIDAAKGSAIKAMCEMGMTSAEICEALEISRATFFRHKAREAV